MKIFEKDQTTPKLQIKKDDHVLDDIFPTMPVGFLNLNAVIVVSGGMGSGKSLLLSNMITNKKLNIFYGKFERILYATPKRTIFKGHPFYNHPPSQTFDNLGKNTFQEFSRQALEVKEQFNGNTLIVIDDFTEQLKNKAIQIELSEMIHTHRHLKCTIIITSLFLKAIPKSIRSLINQYFIFKPKKIEMESTSEDIFDLSVRDLKKLFSIVYKEKYDYLNFQPGTDTYYRNSSLIVMEEDDDEKVV